MSTLLWPLINVAILVGFLFTKLREPARKFVKTRHETLRDDLRSVRDLLAHAQERYTEFTAKLKTIEAEAAVLREQAKQDAASARQRIAAEAQRLSATIVTDARATASSLVTDLRSQLFQELGGRVLDRAEALMRERLTGDDRARIVREFSSQMEKREMSVVAKAYARALYDTASAAKTVDVAQLESQITEFVAITTASPDAKKALFGPVTTAQEKIAIIGAIAKKTGSSELLSRFLLLLVGKSRLNLLPEIQEAFALVRVHAEGGIVGNVVAADVVGQADIDSLAQAFTRKLGKRVSFQVSTDPSLLAGMKVTVNGVTYDGTLRSQFDKLRDSLGQAPGFGKA